MSRVVPALSLCSVAAIGATAWAMLGSNEVDRIGAPTAPRQEPPSAAAGDAARLQAARRTCTVAALDAIVEDLQNRCTPAAVDGRPWHLLAEALLERVQTRSHRRGIVVGEPIYTELPREQANDVDAGLAAVARARELGQDDGDLWRIEAALLSQRITGLGAALQWNARIQQALAGAIERTKDDPRLHIALGLRKLLAPKLLGHDPQRALEHFEFAARSLADDERPAVFAAMASWLQKKRLQAIDWLEQAVARNPDNLFARVVLKRVRRDEPDPFGRDVSDDEAAAAK